MAITIGSLMTFVAAITLVSSLTEPNQSLVPTRRRYKHPRIDSEDTDPLSLLKRRSPNYENEDNRNENRMDEDVTETNITAPPHDRKFEIDYDNDTFTMDGVPFRYISGSIHYFRVPRPYWRDRLRKMRAAGLNAISTSVAWSLHEPKPGLFNFSEDLDLSHFIKLAQEEDLYVILRPGPYISADRDLGGLPYWLWTQNPDINLRTSDEFYLKFVERWMNVLLARVTPLLYGKGGPIIMVQIENKYGSYWACDYDYTTWLRDLFQKHIEDNAVLFTTDEAGVKSLLCGNIPGTYTTVSFGPMEDAKKAFKAMRLYERNGPLVNSEYNIGLVNHWGEQLNETNLTDVTKTLEIMLENDVNVNLYMFHGGTNFGFTNGANFKDKYVADITSYYYNSPITEAGDLTEEYYAIKEVLKHYVRMPNIKIKNFEKGNYGKVYLTAVASLLSPKVMEELGKSQKREYPVTFEALDHGYGYVVYETTFRWDIKEPILFIEHVHDYGVVYVNGNYQGYMLREVGMRKFPLEAVRKGSKLSIIVENMGRIDHGKRLNDVKGILSNVTIDRARSRKSNKQRKYFHGLTNLTNWTMTAFDFDNIDRLELCYEGESIPSDCRNDGGFTFYMGKFTIPEFEVGDDHRPLDSYLNVKDLMKGIVFINNHHLGRYWSARGPQHSIYVPGAYLKPFPEENIMLIMDEILTNLKIRVSFTENPIYE